MLITERIPLDQQYTFNYLLSVEKHQFGAPTFYIFINKNEINQALKFLYLTSYKIYKVSSLNSSCSGAQIVSSPFVSLDVKRRNIRKSCERKQFSKLLYFDINSKHQRHAK